MAKKITPEIEKYIAANRALSGGALKDLIAKKFKIVVTSRSVELYLAKARAEAESDNAAKVEAVRSKILDDAEIESLRKLIKASEEGEHPVALETARDRLAASTALHKMLSTIIDFVKPEEKANVTVNIKPDLSKLSTDELRQLRSIKSKLEGDRSGAGQAESS